MIPDFLLEKERELCLLYGVETIDEVLEAQNKILNEMEAEDGRIRGQENISIL